MRRNIAAAWLFFHKLGYPFWAPLVALGCVAVFQQFTLAQLAENLTVNLRYVARAPFDPPADKRLVFVGIDPVTIDKFGAWPWPRNIEASFLSSIANSGTNPRVVAFDVLFSEDFDRFHAVQAKSGISFDAALEESILYVPCAITAALGVSEDPQMDNRLEEERTALELQKPSKTLPFLHVVGDVNKVVGTNVANLPLRPLRQSSFYGFANDSTTSADGIRYTLPLVLRVQGKVYPSLAMQMVNQILNVDAERVEVNLGHYIKLENAFGKSWKIPINDRGEYAINYRHNDSFKTMSLYWLFTYLHGAEKSHTMPPDFDIAKKALLIGQSATGLTDLGPTPFEGRNPLPLIHLQVVNNILQGDYLKIIPTSWVVLGWLIVSWSTLLMWKKLSLLHVILQPTLVVALYVLCAFVMFAYWSVQIPLFWPVVSYIGVNSGAVILRWREEQLARKEISQLFSTVTSPHMLRMLEENPQLYYEQRKVRATMMFSDVAGFTSVSEMLDPHFLANLMNRYLSPMTEIIVKQDGYVTLYMGDGIMAVWGVLSPDQDQEYHACVAAVRKVEKATQISEVLPDGRLWTFSIRIGLNTGVVSAGNLGSVQKSQYTVMGDDVNLTARLEPTNKDYGTKIIMGPQTFNAVRERVWARPLDKLVVKGKSEGVLIYELIGLREDDPIGPGEWPLLYEKALHHFWAQEWDAAEALFEQVQTMKIGGDKASDMQLKKVRYYRLNPLEFTEATIRKEKD